MAREVGEAGGMTRIYADEYGYANLPDGSVFPAGLGHYVDVTFLPPTITIPDDPEAIALVLCRDHLDCRDHIGGHDAYIWQAKRLLADLRRLT